MLTAPVTDARSYDEQLEWQPEAPRSVLITPRMERP